MKKLLGKLFGPGSQSASRLPEIAAKPAVDMQLPIAWNTEASLPIPDWEDWHKRAPPEADEAILDAHWSAVARRWLFELGQSVDDSMQLLESQRFMLLSSLPARSAHVLLAFCETTRRRILRSLDGIAHDQGHGKHVLIAFDSNDQYYDYVSNYYPEQGEFAMSSGMFLDYGYGHFVMVASHVSEMEPIIVHELTHCLVSHLPLPAWLNEGIAVNTEHALVPAAGDPRNALYSSAEMRAMHADFWNEHTLQEFWSGKSFLRPDEGNRLSYDLATHMARLCGRHYPSFVRFANKAAAADGGATAAIADLGVPLEDLAAAILGDGEWKPQPESWKTGTERGQFRSR